MVAWVLWGAQITTLRIVVAAILELAIVGYFCLCWRLFGR
jgi:hypothetical protein